MNGYLNLAGRILIALLFLGGGLQKIIDPAPVQQMIGTLGLPGRFVWPAPLFNLSMAIGLIFGRRCGHGRWLRPVIACSQAGFIGSFVPIRGR